MKKILLIFPAWLIFIPLYSQQIKVIEERNNQETSVIFLDSSNNVIDKLSIIEFNPWNKLDYQNKERDGQGNYKYVINEAELKLLFRHEINEGLFDTRYINKYGEYKIHSEVYISEPNKTNVAISYNLIADIANTDLTIVAKSYVFILDNNKNILFENKDHSYINRSLVLSNNAEFLVYRTGIQFSEDTELIPMGVEIFDVSKEKVVFTEEGTLNKVLIEPQLNLIRASIEKQGYIYRDIYLNTKKRIIYIHEYPGDSDKIFINLKSEGLYYQDKNGQIELITFESLNKILL